MVLSHWIHDTLFVLIYFEKIPFLQKRILPPRPNQHRILRNWSYRIRGATAAGRSPGSVTDV